MVIFVAHPSVLLTDHLTHGDALAAFNFIRRLAERGHRLHVVAEHVRLREALPDAVALHRITPRRPRSIVDRMRSAYAIRIAFERVRAVERVDVIHQLNPVDLGLSTLLPADRPPLILGPYVPDWPPSVRLGEGAGMLKRVAYRAAGAVKDLIRWQEQRGAAAVLLSTPAAETKLKVKRATKPLIRYLSPGVDTALFHPAASGSDSGPPQPTILFLANLNVRKGIFTLLDAFDAVADRLPGCALRIAGEGEAADRVRRVVDASPYRDRMELLGRVAPHEVPELMRAADVFCLPSFAEPFGISVLEAMACGKPVVATDVGGLAHLVRPEGGRTVPSGDWRALAAALCETLESAELRVSMGSFNRALVERDYSWDRVIDRLEDVYREVVGTASLPTAASLDAQV